MSISHCLNSAVDQKAISRAMADEIDTVYQRFVEQYALIHGDAEARRKAQEELARRLEGQALERRRRALLQAQAIEARWNDVSGYRNARGEVDVLAGMLEMMETHGRRDEGLKGGSLQGRYKAILGRSLERFEGMLAEHTKKLLGGGRHGKAILDNVVRELAGEHTADDAAKRFATAWRDVSEGLRQRFNELGGAIGHLEKWIAPQSHSGEALRKVGFESWSQRISDLLDWDNMRHALSGEPILPGERAEVLEHVYNTITSGGWEKRQPTVQPQGRGALYKQHADHRFLIFKDADSWLSYQRDFGQGDLFATMMGHIKTMSRDIAAMEMFGPNPESTLTWLKQKAKQEAQRALNGRPALVPRKGELLGLKRNPVARANHIVHRVETMWEHYTGAADVAEHQGAAATMSTIRNLTSAGALGSAVLSALSDPGFGAMARSFATGASIPGSVFHQAGAIVDALKGMTQAEAVRAGLILDSAANAVGERAREANAVSGPVISRHMADTVMRVQGLQAWTQGGKHGFGLYLMGEFADRASQGWGELTPQVQSLMRRYGLGELEWDVIRSAARHDLSPDGAGAHVLRPREIAALTIDDVAVMVGGNPELAARARQMLTEVEGLDAAGFARWQTGGDARPGLFRDLFGVNYQLTLDETRIMLRRLVDRNARDLSRLEGPGSLPSDPAEAKVQRYFRNLSERYLEMILQETAYAVPEPTLRSTAATLGATRRGTIQGEAFRAFGQFKSFGVAVALLHGGRVFNELAAGRAARGVGYATAGLATLTMLGMLSMQAKQLAKGEDPRDMTDWRNWSAAMVQAGGFGIYGDFFLADQNRLGGGLTQTIVGPMPGRAADLLKVTLGNIQQASEDKKTNFGRELVRNVRSWDPLASLWFTRLAWDRIAYNNLQRLVDPEAAQAFKRQVDMARRDRQTGYFVPPGAGAADIRLPNFGNAVGVR